ncbi:19427_t:CDS:2, partial [Dentiscutata erythropus]
MLNNPLSKNIEINVVESQNDAIQPSVQNDTSPKSLDHLSTSYVPRYEQPVCDIKITELSEIAYLAAGGFGKVYTAQWKGRRVAVKSVGCKKPRELKDFNREIIAHPRNVLIHEGSTHQIRALLADFGLSKFLLDSKGTSVVRGIAPYVDPKLLFNSNYSHEKSSDIYSFGVLMWEVYTCLPPFGGKSDHKLAFELFLGRREEPKVGMPKYAVCRFLQLPFVEDLKELISERMCDKREPKNKNTTTTNNVYNEVGRSNKSQEPKELNKPQETHKIETIERTYPKNNLLGSNKIFIIFFIFIITTEFV